MWLRGGADNTPSFTIQTFDDEPSVSMPSRNWIVSNASFSAAYCAISTLPSSDTDLMSQLQPATVFSGDAAHALRALRRVRQVQRRDHHEHGRLDAGRKCVTALRDAPRDLNVGNRILIGAQAGVRLIGRDHAVDQLAPAGVVERIDDADLVQRTREARQMLP